MGVLYFQIKMNSVHRKVQIISLNFYYIQEYILEKCAHKKCIGLT